MKGWTDVHDVMAIKPNFLTSMGYHIFLSMVLGLWHAQRSAINFLMTPLLDIRVLWTDKYDLPPVLYLQFDNCVRESKNQFMFALLALVEEKILGKLSIKELAMTYILVLDVHVMLVFLGGEAVKFPAAHTYQTCTSNYKIKYLQHRLFFHINSNVIDIMNSLIYV